MGQSGFVKTGLGLLIVATFLAAYVSFQIQPLAARWMLPRFGGSAGVWSASMLFFQCGLLLGYAYTYLLTKEAFEIYRSRLNPNGVLAVHISNRYFHLQPLMYGLAEALSWDAALVRRPRGPNGYIKRSTWVLMGDNPELFGQRKQWTYYAEWSSEDIENSLVWTDNDIDIFPLLD